MVHMPARDIKTAARMARSAPAATLAEAAAAVGMPARKLASGLQAAAVPGRCAQMMMDLSRRTSDDAGAALLDRPGCPPPLKRVSTAAGSVLSGPSGWRSRRCGQPGAARTALAAASASDDRESRKAAATESLCPPAMLGRLSIDSRSAAVRKAAAHNTSNRPGFLAGLSRDDDLVARYLAAENPSAPRRLLGLPADWPDPDTLYYAAHDWECPPDALDKLASSSDSDVRDALSENPHCDPETLDRVARSNHWAVRLNVTENGAASTKTLKRLAKDSDPAVAEAARKALGT